MWSCAPDGKFEILSVRPGEYYAFAIATDDYFDPNNNLDNELLKQSTPVTVVDNEAITAEIRLIER
jgi:hypothetical protein